MENPEPMWVPLSITSALANSHEDIAANIEYSLTRPHIGLQEILGTESGAVSVVGSGPSLKENWKKLRDSDTDIIACNAACQFLLERGVVPKYMFCFDADPLMLEFITPHPEITYLIGSRCPPKTFDLLEGCKVVLWHASGDKFIEEILIKHNRMEPMVIGGTAAITRCMILAPTLGYTTIHLWGADSSFHNGDTHIRKSTTKERRTLIMCNKRTFECAPWMAQQAEDFKVLSPALRDRGLKLIIHGDGLIPHIAKAMHFDVDGEWRIKQVWREVEYKARTLWSQL